MHLANDGALEFPGQLQEAFVGYGAPGFGFHGPFLHGDHSYLGGFLLVGGRSGELTPDTTPPMAG